MQSLRTTLHTHAYACMYPIFTQPSAYQHFHRDAGGASAPCQLLSSRRGFDQRSNTPLSHTAIPVVTVTTQQPTVANYRKSRQRTDGSSCGRASCADIFSKRREELCPPPPPDRRSIMHARRQIDACSGPEDEEPHTKPLTLFVGTETG